MNGKDVLLFICTFGASLGRAEQPLLGSQHGAGTLLHDDNKLDASSTNELVTSRILARVPQVTNINIRNITLTLFSAVPVFGENHSYIALLSEHNGDSWEVSHWWNKSWNRDLLQQTVIYCGPSEKFHSWARIAFRGSILICPWPREDRHKETFQVYLADEHGNSMGTIKITHQPTLLQQYHTMACVRDVFYDPKSSGPKMPENLYNGAFKHLVQWMEWSLMHGLEHFLIYTFKGTDLAAKEVIQPYLDSGVASRVHFDFYPKQTLMRQGYVANDCLWRAKDHAKWLLTTVDTDEYIVFPRLVKYFDWEGLLKMDGLSPSDADRVAAIFLPRVRFALARRDKIEISSVHREDASSAALPLNRKHIVRVKNAFRTSIHELSDRIPGTLFVRARPDQALIHHYRIPKDEIIELEDYDFGRDQKAHITDPTLLPEVPSLIAAIQHRFKLRIPDNVHKFLLQLSLKYPPPAENGWQS